MTAPPIEQLVGAVMQSYGQLALILDHMSAWSSSDAEPVPEVLRALLVEVLAPLGGAADEAAVATAAQVLAAATATIGAELYLVPGPGEAGCAPRRSAGARRTRGH